MTEPLDVLVVDDDFMVASIHGGFVQAEPGCRLVGTARNGAEALDLVDRLHPDVVLLDLYLPDVPGLEVLRRLRHRHADVDVVVISAAREADMVRDALRGGVTGYLVKPFEAHQLQDRLEDVRERRASLATGLLDQLDVDRALGRGRGESRPARTPAWADPLPKGLSPETALLVDEVLVAATTPLSATEVAAGLGVSRVSVRRYLEHFTETGRAHVTLRYGGTGRPERLYRRT